MLYTFNSLENIMKSFRNYCSNLIVEQKLSLMAKEIAENDYDLEVILEGAFETLIKADPDKAEILLEQQRSFMHSLGSGARKVGQWFSGLGQDFMSGMRGEPLVDKALQNFLMTIQQAGYDANMIHDALEQHLGQQRAQGYGPGGGEPVPAEAVPEPEVTPGPPKPGRGMGTMRPKPAGTSSGFVTGPQAPTPAGPGRPTGQTHAQWQAQRRPAPRKPRVPFAPMPPR
jgi:hypothetical protein